MTVDYKKAIWRPTLWADADRQCYRRHPSACGPAYPHQKTRAWAALSTTKARRGGKPEDKAAWWSGPINATCATSAARVQQRIRRNKKCLAFANLGIFFLQKLISGSMRSLTVQVRSV